MRTWSGLAFLGFVLVAVVLLLHHDLRGWTPADLKNPATVVEPSRPGGAAFSVGDCVPGTLSPWNAPTAEEYAGTATMTVLTCRSRSSAITFALAYLALAAASLLVVLATRRRKPGA